MPKQRTSNPVPDTAAVILGAANDIEAYVYDPGLLLLVVDRLRRYVRDELD